MNDPTPTAKRGPRPSPSPRPGLPRPLRVLRADPLAEEPWYWFCRSCYDGGLRELHTHGAGGWSADQHDANTAARRHWNRCPHTAAAFRRMIAAAARDRSTSIETTGWTPDAVAAVKASFTLTGHLVVETGRTFDLVPARYEVMVDGKCIGAVTDHTVGMVAGCYPVEQSFHAVSVASAEITSEHHLTMAAAIAWLEGEAIAAASGRTPEPAGAVL